jgi:hypothetical protein
MAIVGNGDVFNSSMSLASVNATGNTATGE